MAVVFVDVEKAVAIVAAEAIAEAVVVTVEVTTKARLSPRCTTNLISEGQPVPQPDPAITQLEDRVLKEQSTSLAQLTAKTAKLTLGSTAGEAPTAKDRFPPRPAHGTRGEPVVLYANYFKINLKDIMLYKYILSATSVSTKTVGSEAQPEAEAQPKGTGQAKGKAQGKGKGKGKPDVPNAQPQGRAGKSDSDEIKEIKGRKLYFVIHEVLKELTKNDKSLLLVSDFKTQIISLKKLSLENSTLRLSMPSAANPEKTDVFDIKFEDAIEVRVADMIQYLNSTTAGPDEHDLPRFPDTVDALNVILGHGPRSKHEAISVVGRSRFFQFKDGGITANLTQNGRPLVAARGFFDSVRLGTGRLLLNANVTHGVFKLSGKLDKIFDNFQVTAVSKSNKYAEGKLRTFAKFLAKTRVLVTMKLSNGKEVIRPKAINSVATATEIARAKPRPEHPVKFDGGWEYGGPKNVQFYLEGDNGGRYITVFDYYKQKYGVTLKDYPLMNLGRPEKPTYYPAEYIEIPAGQTIKAKLTAKETTEMLGFACRSPYANALSITTDGRETLGLDDPNLNKFGISVDKQLLTVQGRVLTAPRVSYMDLKANKSSDVTPRDASWNMMRVRVWRPGTMIQRWSFVNVLVGNASPVGKDVPTKFAEFMVGMGIKVSKEPITLPDGHSCNPGTLKFVFDAAVAHRLEFLLVILWTADTGVYSQVKTLGDCTYGIHTSCVQGSKFQKGQPQYFANVGLKWNLKAGGVNHKLRDEFGILKEGKSMIVGYDVTHPTNMPSDKSDEAPSLVGLVASIDRDMGQWPAISWEQKSKQEMLGDPLLDAFKSRLTLWQKHNKGALPINIVIFRDGVSEGQFTQVLEVELPLIRRACMAVYPPSQQPKITILVSVKRHQTRFYPAVEKDTMGNGNIKSGTIVDRGVTQARYWDFFLTAHASIKGTARPAHYTVLLDEVFRQKHGAEAANELEKLTHELCYLYGRATKAVSICPPAYYADIVCGRARVHRPDLFDASDTASMSAASTTASDKQVHPNLQNSMYYM
ncbi:hypothetical protein G7046_g10062 [Stylonectria norvegica]|nr:hypothetical protein G7046_g10062 [Stylonectria norvegica]